MRIIPASRPCMLPGMLTLLVLLLPAPADGQRGEDPDARATARAEEMVRERASAEDVALEMQRAFRLDAAATVAVLHQVKIPEAAVARAAASVFRSSPTEIVSYMAARGMSAEASARALQGGLRLSPEAVAVSLRDGMRLPREEVEQVLRATGLSRELTHDALLQAGFGTPAPGIQRFWIRDYRPGAPSGAIIENDGILNANALSTFPDPSDGEVWIEGINLDRPDTEVFVDVNGGNPTSGQILERTKAGSLDRLRVRFHTVPGPGLMVRHSGGEAVFESRRLLYSVVERELFEEALAGLTVVLGAPEGSGRVEIGSEVRNLTLPPYQGVGMEVILTDVRNNGFSLETASAPNGAALEITIPFLEAGREFRGLFAAYIPCWVCSTFQVPTTECGTLDLFCFAGVLGEALTSLGTCANPANWKEEQILDLPGAPFEGDLSNASFQVRMEVVPNAAGRLAPQNTFYSFQANISIVGPLGDIPLSVIEDYLNGQVTETVVETMEDLDPAAQVADGVNWLANLKGWTRIRGIHPLSQGRFFVDIVL